MVNCCRSVSCVLAVLPEFARIQPGDLAAVLCDFPDHLGGAAGFVAVPRANEAQAVETLGNGEIVRAGAQPVARAAGGRAGIVRIAAEGLGDKNIQAHARLSVGVSVIGAGAENACRTPATGWVRSASDGGR